MPRESNKAKVERTAKIIGGLRATYPDAHCELDHRNPLELLIATILSAQCTDKQVNIVTAVLFKKYRRAADYAAVSLEELQEDIKRIGLFRNKAKSIQNCCRVLVESHGGKVPATMDALVALAGVGRKTANVVLGVCYGIASGVVVDTHVKRISNLLGLTTEANPEKLEQDLIGLLPKKEWIDYSHRIIHHGRKICIARRPQCRECPLLGCCQRVGLAAVEP